MLVTTYDLHARPVALPERNHPHRIDRACERDWHTLGTTGVRPQHPISSWMRLTCMNIGGRGRYRTADRWCVKPELYH
jgi:hypothetical protein